MSSNIYNHNSSVRDIGKLFPEEKRLGTKASDLVSGIALTACLDIDEAFDVLGTPPEQRVAILASTVFCADTPQPQAEAWWLSKRLAEQLESTKRPYHCQRSRRQTYHQMYRHQISSRSSIITINYNETRIKWPCANTNDHDIAARIPNIADGPESALHRFGTALGSLIKAPPINRGLLTPLITGAAGSQRSTNWIQRLNKKFRGKTPPLGELP